MKPFEIGELFGKRLLAVVIKKHPPALQSRRKCLTRFDFKMGDLVLVTTETTNRGQWPFGMTGGRQRPSSNS